MAWPIPSATPPCPCRSTISGLMMFPQSSTATYRRILMCPVSLSISVTAICVPKPKVKFGGSQKCVATRPGSGVGGSFRARYDAPATSANVLVVPCLLQITPPLSELTLVHSNTSAPYFLCLTFDSTHPHYQPPL